MKVSSRQADKIDPALKQALEDAEGHEPLRTVMVLGNEKTAKPKVSPQPNDFPDRTAYRKALIANQQQHQSQHLSSIREELTSRALEVKGGTISRAVVVEGTAGAILSSLDLPDVEHASLDQPLSFDLNTDVE